MYYQRNKREKRQGGKEEDEEDVEIEGHIKDSEKKKSHAAGQQMVVTMRVQIHNYLRLNIFPLVCGAVN